MLILGIESSCDETSIAVVQDGATILSNVIASQVLEHAKYGGIVPEIASRQHLLQALPVLDEALSKAAIRLDQIEAIAVTYGPGLIGSLMVGVNLAKSLAFAAGIPLVGVHHLEGHTYAAWLDHERPDQTPGFPLMVLIASGAHTDLILMHGHGDYELLGRTRDDAAGEAFDKVARILGLGFPGGPAIEKVAKNNTADFTLPRAWMKQSLDFSFSGLKTAVLHEAQKRGVYPPRNGIDQDQSVISNLAAAFQESVVDVISAKASKAVQKYNARGLILGGGVSANGPLRLACTERTPVPVLIPAPRLCTDNGAMIAAAGYYRFTRGIRSGMDLDATPSLSMS